MGVSATTFQAPATSSLDHTVGLALAFLIAQVSVMYACYQVGHIEGMRESGAFTTEFPYTLNGLHVLISIGLVVCTIGLWLRRFTGLVISSIALIFVLAIYGHWYYQTVKYLRGFQTEGQNYTRLRAEVGFFHGAFKWDYIVLALVVILLLWLVVRCVQMAIERRSPAVV